MQEKVLTNYEKIAQLHYRCRPDLHIGDQGFNSALLFGVLTELVGGNQLLYGEYGGGKTTSAEYLHSIFHSLPLGLVRKVALRGNPQHTQESMIAMPNYGAMNANTQTWAQEPFWQHFVLVKPKIIDEFNRVPEPNQAIVLNGVERGDWDYLRGHVSTGIAPLFATANYADNGNNTIIPPIKDRFDVAVESTFPGVSSAFEIAIGYRKNRDDLLNQNSLEKKAINILNANATYADIAKRLEDEVVKPFSKHLESHGYSHFSTEQLEMIGDEIEKVQLGKDAQMYFLMLTAELNVHPKFGQKRSIDDLTGEHGKYLYSMFEGSGSRRTEMAIVKYAKALSWLTGNSQVTLEHVLAVAPFAMWHKMHYSAQVMGGFESDTRSDPLQLYITKKLVNEGTDSFPGVKKRFMQHKKHLEELFGLLRDRKTDVAAQMLENLSQNGNGHPLYIDIQKEL